MNASQLPAHPYYPYTQRPKNGKAIASLVLGITGWVMYLAVFCFNITFGTLLSIATYGVGLLCLLPLGCISPALWLAAVITGHMGLNRSRVEAGNGRGMAITGLVTGYIGLGILLLSVLFVIGMILITGGIGFLGTIFPYLNNSSY